MLQPNEIIRNERGAEVCHRIVKAVVEKVPGDASKGHHSVDAYCNQPVVLSVSEGGKICVKCDKLPPVGNVKPRTINSADIKLTAKELEECGTSGTNPAPVKVQAKQEETVAAVEAKVAEIKKDEVVLTIPLSELEGGADIAALLIKKVIAGFGTLPTSNYAESKRIMKLEEKLEKMLVA